MRIDERLAADSGFEGVACVDDTSRAAVLALGAYELDGDGIALEAAEHWLAFLAYMQLPDGRFCNFIADWSGRRNVRVVTSVPGGMWWTARALWALSVAYRLTGEPRFYEAFRRGWVRGSRVTEDITALMLLGTLETLQRTHDQALEDGARLMADGLAATTVDGHLVNHPGEASFHLWGYEQVTALVAAARHFHELSYLELCETSANVVYKRQAEEGPFKRFPEDETSGICPYDVSCCCRGLEALYEATGKDEYARWLERLMAWFDGDNEAGVPLYERAEGRCSDGIDHGRISHNCGAESAIEAGLAEVAWQKHQRRLQA